MRFLGLLLACGVSALAPDLARAQQPRTYSAEETDAAHAAYERGSALLSEGHAREAVAAFEQSRRIVPNVPNTYGLAVAHHELGEDAKALEWLESLLAGQSGDVGEHIGEVSAFRDEIVAARARLRVEIRGAARAEIRVDDEFVGVVSTASLVVPVDPGLHHVQASAGGEVVARDVRAERGAEAVASMRFAEPTSALAPSEVAASELAASEASQSAVMDEAPAPHRRRRVIAIVVTSIVVLAGAVALGFVLSGQEPIVDPVTGIGETLLFGP